MTETTEKSESKGHSHSELMKLYNDGDSADQEIFAEERSNLLLYSGEHYTKRVSNYYKRIRDSKELSTEQKLRLTKNHLGFICDVISNTIVAPNPGVGFSPRNEKELHDQKVAEMHHAVWRNAYDKYDVDDMIDDWADEFTQIGEVATKIYFNPNKGKIKAYEHKMDESGNPLFLDHNGMETTDDGSAMGMSHQPAPDKSKPIREGDFCFDKVLGFNLIRPVECKDLKKAAHLTIRSMQEKDDLDAMFPDKKGFIKASQDETFIVFDSTRGNYGRVQNQVLLMETYFRPCEKYPNGYFYYFTKEGILDEGELPGGIFPIVVAPFMKFSTTPRGRSLIKRIRPYQAEVNRAASKMAEHQITLGDDKLLIQNGTKTSASAALPGVRTISYTGSAPSVLPGRDGSQYLNYMNSQISEMYQVVGVKEATEDADTQLDPYILLYRSARDKKKFQRYIKRFEKFLIQVVKTYLELAKVHLPDDTLIYSVGNKETINLSEFRSQKDLCYEIKIEAQSEDIETKLGKQIVLNHALQYVGGQLKPEDIGKILRQMPYSNLDASFDDLTLNYDATVNDILALDRGERPPVNQYDDHVYSIKRLVSRMRQADFPYLNPAIKQNYEQKIAMHQQMEAQRQLSIQRAQQGLIPTGGYMVVSDLYVPDPANPNKTQRVKLPSEAMQWLIKNLEAQQSGLAPLADLNGGAQAQIADKFSQMSNPQPSPMGKPGILAQ